MRQPSLPRRLLWGFVLTAIAHRARPEDVRRTVEEEGVGSGGEAARPPSWEREGEEEGIEGEFGDLEEMGEEDGGGWEEFEEEFEVEADQDMDCGAWADLGECEKNEAFMLEHCAESCYHQHLVRSAVLTGVPFAVECDTTVGPFTLELHPTWAPWGVERFLKLLGDGWFDHSPFFRAVPKFLVQFGCSLDDEVVALWADRPAIPDDAPDGKPLPSGFKRGMVAFAGNGPHSRTDQLFIAFSDSENLGAEPWETPIGVVVEGMEALDTMAMYGDFPAFGGNGPDPDLLRGPGAAAYLRDHFRDMDYILECRGHLPVDAAGDAIGEL